MIWTTCGVKGQIETIAIFHQAANINLTGS